MKEIDHASTHRTVLAMDVGTTAVKVCLFSADLTLERKSLQEYALAQAGDRVEAPLETYLEAIRRGVQEVLAEGARPAALCLTTQGETLTVADAQGVPLRPFLVWLDQRASEEAHALRTLLPEDRFYRETGLPGLNGALPLAKVRWLKNREPALFQPGHRVLLLEDALLAFLTGRIVTEKALQTSTGWFSLRKDHWWPEALSAVGLSEAELPALLESGALVGPITAHSARLLGLPSGLPVFTGAMDQVSASYALSRLLPATALETTGTALVTGGVLQGLEALDRPHASPVTVYRHVLPGEYMLLPLGNTGGMCLTWFRNQFASGQTYSDLDRMAQSVPAGCEGLLFLPFLDGMVDPEACPEARAVFFGAGLSTTRAHFTRAIMEGVAHLLADLLDTLEAWGTPAQTVISLGGGARSPLWEQIKADLCGREFCTVSCEEAAALGAALLALEGIGALKEGIPTLTPLVRFIPDPAAHRVYQEAHEKYRRLLQALRPLYSPQLTDEFIRGMNRVL